MAREGLSQQPGADVDVGARVVEVALTNPVTCQRRQVRAVDLHQPDVIGAGALAVREVDGLRVQP